MEPVLYFYTTDGTNTFGPVTEDALRQLFKDQIIGPGSFLCPQGETEWKPVDLEWLRRPRPQTLRLPAYEPPPYVPTDKAKQREEQRSHQHEEIWDEGPHSFFFKWGGFAFAFVATVLLGLKQAGLPNIIAGFLAGVLFVVLIPYLIEQSFKRAWRLRVRAIAMAALALLSFIGEAGYHKLMRMEAASPASRVTAPVAATASTISPVQTQTEKPAAVDSAADLNRMVQALQPVQQEMAEKVNASNAAEKACGNFDPASLTTQTELGTLRSAIGHLRTTQADVLAYFQTYDDRCRTALARGSFDADAIERFVASVHHTAHIDQAVAIWQVRIRLTDGHMARLDFLDKHWGSWQVKNGNLLFTNQADLDTYNQLTQNLITAIKQGNDLQSQVLAK